MTPRSSRLHAEPNAEIARLRDVLSRILTAVRSAPGSGRSPTLGIIEGLADRALGRGRGGAAATERP